MIMKELAKELEQLSPSRYACSWDNVGLLVGRYDQEIKKVVVTLDATNEVIEEAKKRNADLILTHHPIIFSSMKRVNDETILGRKLMTLIENTIACYAMHTNFDTMGGMAQIAEQRLQLQNTIPLEVTAEEDGKLEGIGRVGMLERPMTLLECANFVKETFSVPNVMIFGEDNRMVQKVAVCPGSGKGMIDEALKKGADVLITGDMGHHDGVDALDAGLSIIDAGHHGLEHIFIAFMTKFLKEKFPELIVEPVDSKCPFWIV